ncbi:Hypothetical predicted protein, partial [Olea europaea subsp. europaea]
WFASRLVELLRRVKAVVTVSLAVDCCCGRWSTIQNHKGVLAFCFALGGTASPCQYHRHCEFDGGLLTWAMVS